jgi:hypothetical protein
MEEMSLTEPKSGQLVVDGEDVSSWEISHDAEQAAGAGWPVGGAVRAARRPTEG